MRTDSFPISSRGMCTLVSMGETYCAALDEPAYITTRLRGLDESIQQKHTQIAQWQQYKRTLYESLMRGIIEKEDYQTFGVDYDGKIAAAEAQCVAIREQMAQLKQPNGSDRGAWVRELSDYGRIKAVGRELVVQIVERVTVSEDSSLGIVFRFADQYAAMLAVSQGVTEMQQAV